MATSVRIATCTLNQLALDFDGNVRRTIESIEAAFEAKAFIRVGPELELSGYSCEDAFFEPDTVFHSWQSLANILSKDFNHIIIDVGMPIMKDSSLYNCRVIIFNQKILTIRAKTKLANNGNYRESRWFAAWPHSSEKTSGVTMFKLPQMITKITGQTYVTFGSDIVLEVSLPETEFSVLPTTVRIGFEMCEELWSIDSSNVRLFNQRSVDIVVNSSASYWELGKLDQVLGLMQTATRKSGGVYVFSNLIGCDGSRLCFYGRSLILLNGNVIAQTTTEATILNEVETVIVTVSLADIINYRTQRNIKPTSHCSLETLIDINEELNQWKPLTNVKIAVSISNHDYPATSPSIPVEIDKPQSEEEILRYGSLWLWDYLRKSRMKGFIVPLSGGLDSCSVACLVYGLSYLVSVNWTNISPELRSFLGASDLSSPKTVCNVLLRCCYLKTQFSGKESEKRALHLARVIGAQSCVFDFNSIYETIDSQAGKLLQQFAPSKTERIGLLQQNLQARLRMVLTYYLSNGDRLVLSTGNVDEALVGYLTRYDCSSADLNPIGSISMQDLRKFIAFFSQRFFSDESSVFKEILDAKPSAELTGAEQSDEDDLGLTYEELTIFGRMRRGDLGCSGPYGLFIQLRIKKNELGLGKLTDHQLAQKVKRFFTLHARNRHKQTILTPALHAMTYSPDDNRFDHRQFLFETQWKRQFECIDHVLSGTSADS